MPRSAEAVIRRAFDTAAAAAGLVVLAPLFLAIAVAIRRDSPGPVFFRQIRAGLGGQAFGMYKFRTMVEGADDLRAELVAHDIGAHAEGTMLLLESLA